MPVRKEEKFLDFGERIKLLLFLAFAAFSVLCCFSIVGAFVSLGLLVFLFRERRDIVVFFAGLLLVGVQGRIEALSYGALVENLTAYGIGLMVLGLVLGFFKKYSFEKTEMLEVVRPLVLGLVRGFFNKYSFAKTEMIGAVRSFLSRPFLSWKNLLRVAGLLAFLAAAIFLTPLQIQSAALLTFFLGCLVFGCSARILFIAALTGLVSLPIFLILEKEALSELVATYVYYFVIVGIIQSAIMGLKELKNKKKIKRNP